MILFEWQIVSKIFLTCFGLLILLLVLVHRLKIAYSYRWSFGVLLCFIIGITGMLNAYFYYELNWTNHYSHHLTDENCMVGTVKTVRPGSKYLSLSLEVKKIDRHRSTVSGNLLVYLPVDTLHKKITVGSELVMTAKVLPIAAPKNPQAFDFSRYMHTQNVHYQAFLKPGNWQVTAGVKTKKLKRVAREIQGCLLNVLQRHLRQEDLYAIAAALVLGDKAAIDEELRSAYANTGAMHVLAVSGLHVGLLYMGLGFLLKNVSKNSVIGSFFKALIPLVVIWAFAFISGASASVLRAATMFSFFVVAKAIKRDGNVYNILAASAFCLLLINPYAIMDVGFQLSYLALLGIIFFQRKIYRFIFLKNKWGDHIWKLISVGIAAQLTTFPLTIFYFHQFPLYFWLSGVIVVPAAALILSLGMLLFLVNCIPIAGLIVGKALTMVIWGVNSLIFGISQLPQSTIGGIWIDVWQLALLYFSLVCLMVFTACKRKLYVWLGLAGLLLVGGYNVWTHYQSEIQQEIVVYHRPGGSLVECFHGKMVYSFSSPAVSNKELAYVNQNYHWFNKVKAVNHYDLNPLALEASGLWGSNYFLQFFDCTLAIVDSTFEYQRAKYPLSVDYVLLSGRQRVDFTAIAKVFDPQLVILDASNPYWVTRKWKAQAEQQGMACVDINEEGALVIEVR